MSTTDGPTESDHPTESDNPTEAALVGDTRRARTKVLSLTYPGLIGALLFFFLSLTPSLLPRPWLYEAIVAGVGSLVGYALGVFVWWVIRKIWKGPVAPRISRWGWIALADRRADRRDRLALRRLPLAEPGARARR